MSFGAISLAGYCWGSVESCLHLLVNSWGRIFVGSCCGQTAAAAEVAAKESDNDGTSRLKGEIR